MSRGECTSYHCTPLSEYAKADPELAKAAAALALSGLRRVVGASWTTDAPFREITEAIEAACAKGILTVEMKASALWAFADVVGQSGGDFEKGEADGARDALAAPRGVIAGLQDDPLADIPGRPRA